MHHQTNNHASSNSMRCIISNPKSSSVNFDELSDNVFIKEKQLIESQVIPFSSSTLWQRVKNGTFPEPIKLSEQITAWKVKDIRLWLSDPLKYKTYKLGACNV